MSQSREFIKSITTSKSYLKLRSNNSNNFDVKSFIKSSPHIVHAKILKKPMDKQKTCGNRIIKKISVDQMKANILNESLIHGKGRVRSHSQVSKLSSSKSKHNEQSKTAKDFKINESLNYGRLRKNFTDDVTTDLTYTCKSQSNKRFVNQTLESSEVLMKSTENLRKKPLGKCDSEYQELASELERKLRKSIKESSSGDSQDKYVIHRYFFSEIIKSDPYFGGLLKMIKEGYEAKFKNMREIGYKLRDKLEEERSKRKESEQQKLSLLKELKKQTMYIESLKANLRKLKKSNYDNKENLALNNSEPVPCKKIKKMAIPKLDLSKIHSQLEEPVLSGGMEISETENILDYHDEFMAMEAEFSKSWKDALAKEKRY